MLKIVENGLKEGLGKMCGKVWIDESEESINGSRNNHKLIRRMLSRGFQWRFPQLLIAGFEESY